MAQERPARRSASPLLGSSRRANSSDTEKARRQARAATEKAKQLYRDNSVISGLVAVVAGAIAGSTLPTTRLEQDKLGDINDTAREAMSGQKDVLFDKAEKALGSVETKIDRPAQ